MSAQETARMFVIRKTQESAQAVRVEFGGPAGTRTNLELVMSPAVASEFKFRTAYILTLAPEDSEVVA